MKFREMIEILDGKIIAGVAQADLEIQSICAADLMSDVLAFAEPGSVLVTGLCNPQVVFTASMAEIVGIVFVRGKNPAPETVALAEEEGIPLGISPYTMFETCGRLYRANLHGLDWAN